MTADVAVRPYDEPEAKQRAFARARRLEWVTIGFLVSIGVVMYLAMGSSQAMRTAWFEDLLSLVPPIAFLVAMRNQHGRASERYPYGRVGASHIAFLCAALALLALGLYLLTDAVLKLAQGEHPTIGTAELFGRRVWLGWIMLAALAYSVVPPVILGRLKQPLARELFEKTLHADAAMNRADWATGLAAATGVLGVGFGLWWADSAAAALIALDITRDGAKHVRRVMINLLDHRPTQVEGGEADPVVDLVRGKVEELPFVERARVRLRESGHLLAGEVFVVLGDEIDVPGRLRAVADVARAADWRIYDVVATVEDPRIRVEPQARPS